MNQSNTTIKPKIKKEITVILYTQNNIIINCEMMYIVLINSVIEKDKLTKIHL